MSQFNFDNKRLLFITSKKGKPQNPFVSLNASDIVHNHYVKELETLSTQLIKSLSEADELKERLNNWKNAYNERSKKGQQLKAENDKLKEGIKKVIVSISEFEFEANENVLGKDLLETLIK